MISARAAGAVVRHEYQQGKGNVIRRMFREIDARVYVVTDGDDTYPAEFAREMVDQVLVHQADMVVDVNHSNSDKKFREQIRITSEVLHSRSYNPELKKLIKGVMIESYLVEGCQSIDSERVYGKSITDPCLGWEDTEHLIYEIAERC